MRNNPNRFLTKRLYFDHRLESKHSFFYRVQLEVRYPLPSLPNRRRFKSKFLQVTLRKENGSFGMVVRGGAHEDRDRKRPFTVAAVARYPEIDVQIF